jgi:hypothetical protein
MFYRDVRKVRTLRLATYALRLAKEMPPVCIDEAAQQLLVGLRGPIIPAPRRGAREDPGRSGSPCLNGHGHLVEASETALGSCDFLQRARDQAIRARCRILCGLDCQVERLVDVPFLRA